jgi:hypothetical protein
VCNAILVSHMDLILEAQCSLPMEHNRCFELCAFLLNCSLILAFTAQILNNNPQGSGSSYLGFQWLVGVRSVDHMTLHMCFVE